MDPVSHLLFARMLAALRDERHTSRALVVATTAGGMAPDVDAVLMGAGWDIYLRWHEAGTHSLVGTLATAVLTAAVVRYGARDTPWPALILAAWVGTLSHVVFDLVSSATLQPFWPLSSWRLTAPVVAMADPLAIACLLAGAAALYVWPRRPRQAAMVALTLLAVLCAAKLVTRSWATAVYRQASGPEVVRTGTEAAWGSWRDWLFFDRTATGDVRAWSVDGWSGVPHLRFTQATREGTDVALASRRQFATARNFAQVHPYAFVTREPREGGHVVFWSDARFCWTADEAADPQEGVPHQDVRPPWTPLRCAMWFGGSLDRDGQPVEALVWLGGHLQRRSP